MSNTPMRMSQKLREALEYIAAQANDGESHVVGDALERILGYDVGDDADNTPCRREARGEEQPQQ